MKILFDIITILHPKGVAKIRDIGSRDKKITEVVEFAEHMETMHKQVNQHLKTVNDKYKDWAYTKRYHKEFVIGDEFMVYL